MAGFVELWSVCQAVVAAAAVAGVGSVALLGEASAAAQGSEELSDSEVEGVAARRLPWVHRRFPSQQQEWQPPEVEPQLPWVALSSPATLAPLPEALESAAVAGNSAAAVWEAAWWAEG